MNELKDSGQRTASPTGAVRDSAAGRGMYELISPIMMERVAIHLEKGAHKYEPRNWEKGLEIARCFGSLFRHSWQAFLGRTDEDHLAAVICNAMFIMHILEMIERGALPASLDDRPRYEPATTFTQPEMKGTSLFPGKPDRLDGKPPRDADGFMVCQFCKCRTNAMARACCDAGCRQDVPK